MAFPEFLQNGNLRGFIISKESVRFLFAVLILALPAAAQAQSRTIDFSDPKSVSVAQSYAAPRGEPSSAEIALLNGALAITNKAPGTFGVQWNLSPVEGKPLDGDTVERLSFDIKPDPTVKINWFFQIGTKFYGVTVTGPDTVRPGSVWLGRALMTPLPNGWQHVEIPLREWLRGADPLATSFPIDFVLSGNWDNNNYLLAGIGGNPPGSKFLVDNIRITTPDEKDALPSAGTPRIEGNDIVWPLTVPAGLKTQGIKLRAANRDFMLSSPFLSYETKLESTDSKTVTQLQELRLHAAQADIYATDAGSIPLQLLGLKDALNRDPNPVPVADKGIEAQVMVNFAEHRENVPLPRIQFDGTKSAPNFDFEVEEEGVKGITAISIPTTLKAGDEKVPANGEKALRLYNPRIASSFGTTLRNAPFDAAAYPVFTFDYRAEDRARLDFQFTWGGKSYSIRFLDRDNDQARIGIIDNVVTDNKWHQVTVPLLDWMKKAQPSATSFEIRDLSLLDMGWGGNAAGVEVWLDNFRCAPLVTDTLKATLSLKDITGIKATSWVFDQKPLSVPDTKAMGTANIEVPVKGQTAGLWWLHVRAQNGAGQWSQTAHFPVVVGAPAS